MFCLNLAKQIDQESINTGSNYGTQAEQMVGGIKKEEQALDGCL